MHLSGQTQIQNTVKAKTVTSVRQWPLRAEKCSGVSTQQSVCKVVRDYLRMPVTTVRRSGSEGSRESMCVGELWWL